MLESLRCLDVMCHVQKVHVDQADQEDASEWPADFSVVSINEIYEIYFLGIFYHLCSLY